MIRHTLVFLALSAGAATAQSVPVRTAEHGDFTRIAVDFPAGADWRIEQEGRTVRVITAKDASYDLSNVYRRIGRDRVGSLRQTSPNELVVDLACACSPTTFSYGNSLVLDIAPGFPEAVAETDDPAPAASKKTLIAMNPGTLLPGLLTRGLELEAEERPTDVPKAQRASRAAALRAQISADLGLTADDPTERLVGPSMADELETTVDAPRPEHLLVESQVSRDTRGYEKISPLATCPAFSEETLESWASARRMLSPEVGDAPWIAAEAKRLIALGFGVEAAQLLDVVDSEDRTASLLNKIAQLVDEPRPAPEIAEIAECGNILTLFALIADPPATPARIGSVLDALVSSPPDVRATLERRAIAGLMALGREEDARILAGSSDRRGADIAPPDLTSLALAAGEDQIPASDLEGIVSRRTPEAAAAIRMMVDGLVDERADVPPVLLDQARALLPEITGTDRDRLQRAIIRAETAAGRYVRAAEAIDTLAQQDPAMAERLDEDLFSAILSIKDDALFLTQIIALDDRKAPNADLRIALANRIADNHVPKLALRTLLPEDETPTSDEKLLAARFSLETDDPDGAEIQLAGLTVPEADELRRQIAVFRANQAPQPAPPAPEAPTGLRARGSVLVEESANLRAELEQFLGN